jgi:hypothetical protein
MDPAPPSHIDLDLVDFITRLQNDFARKCGELYRADHRERDPVARLLGRERERVV